MLVESASQSGLKHKKNSKFCHHYLVFLDIFFSIGRSSFPRGRVFSDWMHKYETACVYKDWFVTADCSAWETITGRWRWHFDYQSPYLITVSCMYFVWVL